MTPAFGGQYSIQLSYRRIVVGAIGVGTASAVTNELRRILRGERSAVQSGEPGGIGYPQGDAALNLFRVWIT